MRSQKDAGAACNRNALQPFSFMWTLIVLGIPANTDTCVTSFVLQNLTDCARCFTPCLFLAAIPNLARGMVGQLISNRWRAGEMQKTGCPITKQKQETNPNKQHTHRNQENIQRLGCIRDTLCHNGQLWVQIYSTCGTLLCRRGEVLSAPRFFYFLKRSFTVSLSSLTR